MAFLWPLSFSPHAVLQGHSPSDLRSERTLTKDQSMRSFMLPHLSLMVTIFQNLHGLHAYTAFYGICNEWIWNRGIMVIFGTLVKNPTRGKTPKSIIKPRMSWFKSKDLPRNRVELFTEVSGDFTEFLYCLSVRYNSKDISQSVG